MTIQGNGERAGTGKGLQDDDGYAYAVCWRSRASKGQVANKEARAHSLSVLALLSRVTP